MEHDASVVRETPLLLVRGLPNVVRRGARRHAAARTDPRVRVARVPPRPRVMVLSEYLRYVLAGDGADGTALVHDRRLLGVRLVLTRLRIGYLLTV